MTNQSRDSGTRSITLTQEEFLSHIKGNKRDNKRYCFILGAGASISSGIRSASELAKEWLEEIRLSGRYDSTLFNRDYENGELKLTARPGVDASPARYYSYIYDKRFELDLDEGYFAIEQEMKKPEKNEPLKGYRLLARILTTHPSFKIVITTNFDRLTEDAISSIGESPQVISHESLAGFLKPLIPTPTVIKIHRDLSFHPQNSSADIQKLNDRWEGPLKQILQHNIPIVIGYGGNDGSLMDFLQKENESPLFWCSQNPDNLVEENSRIIKTVKKSSSGRIVKIKNFDDFMQNLADTLGIGYLPVPSRNSLTDIGMTPMMPKMSAVLGDLDILGTRDDQIKSSRKKEEELPPGWDVANKNVKDWWQGFDAQDKDKDKNKDKEHHPSNCVLSVIRQLKRRALTITDFYQAYMASQIDDIHINLRYLDIQWSMEKEKIRMSSVDEKAMNDELKRLYQEKIKTQSECVLRIVEYADFLKDIHDDKDDKEAKKYYKQALDKEPDNIIALNNFAIFLYKSPKKKNEAENCRKEIDKFYRKALRLGPQNALVRGNFANFLCNIGKDDEAKEHYKQALKDDPRNAVVLRDYANFLYFTCKKYDEAEKYYELALGVKPKDVHCLCNYASFLREIRTKNEEADKRYERAKEVLEKALEAKPVHPSTNLACLILCAYCILSGKIKKEDNKKDDKVAIDWLDLEYQKLSKREQLIFSFFKYILEPENRLDHAKKIQELLDRGVRREGWYFDYLLASEHIKNDSNYSDICSFAKKIKTFVVEEA